MKKKILFILFLPIQLFAQDAINITYEKGVLDLIEKYKKIQKETYQYERGVEGWRIQIAFANKESQIAPKHIEFLKKYPEIPIYLTYKAPYYRLRIGNFRTKIEAERIKNEISKDYRGYIVADYINFSLK